MNGQIGVVLAGVLAASKAMRMAGETYVGYKRMPLETAGALGAATQGFYGHEIQGIYGGRQMAEMSYLPEKRVASGMSQQAIQSQKAVDRALSATGMATAGLRSGHIGTAVAGFAMGLVNDVFNERSRNYDLAQLKNIPGLRGIGQQYEKRYEAKNAEDY